jgi:hypothetical protein
MTPEKLILRSCLHMHLLDNLRGPAKDLWKTSEANINSHLRSSLDILRKFHRPLDRCQVDAAQEGIVIHKRGRPQNGDKMLRFLCLETHCLEGFHGNPVALENQRKKKRLLRSLETLDSLRIDQTRGFSHSALVVISGPRTFFLKLNDQDFKRCDIKEISTERKKRFIDIIDRVIYLTKENDFADRSVFQAKVLAYGNDIDEVMNECMEQKQLPVMQGIQKSQIAKEARLESHL